MFWHQECFANYVNLCLRVCMSVGVYLYLCILGVIVLASNSLWAITRFRTNPNIRVVYLLLLKTNAGYIFGCSTSEVLTSRLYWNYNLKRLFAVSGTEYIIWRHYLFKQWQYLQTHGNDDGCLLSSTSIDGFKIFPFTQFHEKCLCQIVVWFSGTCQHWRMLGLPPKREKTHGKSTMMRFEPGIISGKKTAF